MTSNVISSSRYRSIYQTTILWTAVASWNMAFQSCHKYGYRTKYSCSASSYHKHHRTDLPRYDSNNKKISYLSSSHPFPFGMSHW